MRSSRDDDKRRDRAVHRAQKRRLNRDKSSVRSPDEGELLLLQGAPGAAAAAEGLFRQALDWARQQGALSWKLRAATSLARLRRNQGCPADAVACLRPIYDRFTEGFGTADLITAKQLLDELSRADRQQDTASP